MTRSLLNRLLPPRRALEPLLEAGKVVVDGALRLGRELGAVHACAECLFDSGAAGGCVACRGPACCSKEGQLSPVFQVCSGIEDRMVVGGRTYSTQRT